MRKRVQIALAVVLVAVLALLAWQILRFREPVYGGNVCEITRFTVQHDAILGLGELHHQPEIVIPILVEFVDKPQNPQHVVLIRDCALWSLRQFREQAKPAIPTLLKLLNDTDPNFRSEVTNTLLAIDSEAATKAGVQSP